MGGARAEAERCETRMSPADVPATGERSNAPAQAVGFALVAVLVLLVALYLGATGIFLAAKAELRIGVSHVASSQAFYLADSGLATWLASPVQPSAESYEIGGETVTVLATALLRVDSVTVLYRIAARATVGGTHPGHPGIARRETSLLGRREGLGPVRRIVGTWREVL